MTLILRLEERVDGKTVRTVGTVALPGRSWITIGRGQNDPWPSAGRARDLAGRAAFSKGFHLPANGAMRRIKDYRTRRLDTLFGRVSLRLPRVSCPSCER